MQLSMVIIMFTIIITHFYGTYLGFRVAEMNGTPVPPKWVWVINLTALSMYLAAAWYAPVMGGVIIGFSVAGCIALLRETIIPTKQLTA